MILLMTSATNLQTNWRPDDTLTNRLVLMRTQLKLSQRKAAELCGITFGEWQSVDARAALAG